MKLKEILTYCKTALKAPYHVFYMSKDMCCIRLEQEYSKDYWVTSGESFYKAAMNMYDYIQHEIKQGTIKEPKIKKSNK